jgi:hypothetical protein
MDIRRLVTLAMLAGVLALPGLAAAANTIYGTLTGPDGPNASLVLACERATATANADKAGSYRLTVNDRGRCHLRVNNMPAPGELVFVYEDATRYDYEVTKAGGVTRISRR